MLRSRGGIEFEIHLHWLQEVLETDDVYDAAHDRRRFRNDDRSARPAQPLGVECKDIEPAGIHETDTFEIDPHERIEVQLVQRRAESEGRVYVDLTLNGDHGEAVNTCDLDIKGVATHVRSKACCRAAS